MSSEQEDKTIIFICRNCGEHMTVSLRSLAQRKEREIWAPNLCPECGKYPPDRTWNWMSRAMVAMTIRQEFESGRHTPHGWRQECRVARTQLTADVDKRKKASFVFAARARQ